MNMRDASSRRAAAVGAGGARLLSEHESGSSAGTTILSVEDLVVDFPTPGGMVRAVDGTSLQVRKGQRIGIVGESGSGKSTLALAILGLLEPPGLVTGGRILFDGSDLTTASEDELRAVRGGKIAMIFQDALGSLNPVLTIGRQLCEAILLHQTTTQTEATAKAIELLREVDLPSPELGIHQYPHEFSGGMRQRVMIAMALACNPALLIADEPTTALDVTTQAGVIDLLMALSTRRQLAVIFVTHDLGIIAGFAEDVLVMYAGAPMEYGPVDDIFYRSRHPYTHSLMAAIPRITDARGRQLRSIPGTLPSPGTVLRGCRFQPRCFLSHGRGECSEVRPAFDLWQADARAACHFADEMRRVVSRESPLAESEVPAVTDSSWRAPEAEVGLLLEVGGLTKTYAGRMAGSRRRRGVRAVDDASFFVAPGESLGLVGESGSGKTTLARLLLGLTPRDVGDIALLGSPLPRSRRRLTKALRGRVQMVFQDPADSLDPMMTVGQIIGEPLRLLKGWRLRDFGVRIEELIDLVGLARDHKARRPGALSGGEKQRVAIARALATEPKLVVCDEAVSSLDVSVRAQILNLLMELQRRLGVSYLYISHDLSVVRHICDRVIVMYAGHFVEAADADSLFHRPQHPYTVALLSAVPVADPAQERRRARIRLEGEPPDVTKPVRGCIFRSRCWKAQEICATESPGLLEHVPGHWSACHFPEVAQEEAALPRAEEGH